MATAQLETLLRHIEKLVAGHGVQQRSDRQLLDDFVARRSEAAFTALVSRHGPMVLRVCRRVLNHEQDAEDAFQATFLVLASNARSIRKRDTVGDWLHGVAHRTALNTKRSAARRRGHEARAGARAPLGASSPSWDDVQSVLDEEVQRLPRCYRQAFVLCVLQGKSGSQAAAELDCKEGTVKSRVNRARGLLQGRLARRGIKLAALLAALSVAEGAGGAALSATLACTAIRSGLLVAASGPVGGAIPSQVAALAAGVTRAMFLTKAKTATAMLVAMGLLTAAGALTYRGLTAMQIPPQAQNNEPPAREEPMPRAADAKRAPAGTKSEPAKTITVSGRVLDPAGNPVRLAKLFASYPKIPESVLPRDNVVKQVAETGADGRFHVTVERGRRYLIAHAPGFGVDWVDLNEDEPPVDVTIRLVKDVPIAGRVLNTEGRPIAGVSVSAATIYVPNDKLDDYLAGWLHKWQDTVATPRKRLAVPLDGIVGPAVTDKDGRFALPRVGGERIVQVTFSHGVARSHAWVITRSGFDAGPYNAALRSESRELFELDPPLTGLYPPSLTFVAEPGKAVEGMVKDAASGKPLPGCIVHATSESGDASYGVSDASGKFHTDGLPKGPNEGYHVGVSAPKGSAYLGQFVDVRDTEGFTTIRHDFELVKGAVVTGWVVDKQTGKGVQCGVRCAPLQDNKFFGSKPGFGNFDVDRTMLSTDKEGRFRLVTIPGEAVILAQVNEGLKFNGEHLCVYRNAVPDPDHKSLFKDGCIATADGVEILGDENAVKVIEIKTDEETKVELFVDPGTTARIVVQDPDGKPLAGAWAAGVTDRSPITYKLPEATATVYALDPQKPRKMAFFQPEKKLGGTAIVRAGATEPVVVKLAPLGQLSGRLLDTEGNPLDGVDVSILPSEETGSELYRFAAPPGKTVRTDNDGRFRLEGAVPNLDFGLSVRRENSSVGEPRIGVKVKPGQTLDLGTIRVKPAQ